MCIRDRCSTYSVLPLTHRGLSHSVRFITGHFHDDEILKINWDKVADPESTLVIYMGLANLRCICDELVIAGLPATTPAAAIHGGTTSKQQKVISNLSGLPGAVRLSKLESPVLIIVGEVVSLSDDLDWFQQRHRTNGEAIVYESLSIARA